MRPKRTEETSGRSPDGQLPDAPHLPVMLVEVMQLLRPKEGGTYVDATVGAGGHAAAVLGAIGPDGRLLCVDRDDSALKTAKERLRADPRCTFKKARFSELASLIAETGFENADGVLFDFGLSMMQLKDESRGFSFNSEERLDMRMDATADVPTAYDIVNTAPGRELERIFKEYGEERRARALARAIERRRRKARIETCAELAGLMFGVLGRRGRTHPATKAFQALRVAVNDELGEIETALPAAAGALTAGGRLVALSYHSLEDRIVKHFMRDSGKSGYLRVLTKKPLTPTRAEAAANPSARSAKLRGAEKP